MLTNSAKRRKEKKGETHGRQRGGSAATESPSPAKFESVSLNYALSQGVKPLPPRPNMPPRKESNDSWVDVDVGARPAAPARSESAPPSLALPQLREVAQASVIRASIEAITDTSRLSLLPPPVVPPRKESTSSWVDIMDIGEPGSPPRSNSAPQSLPEQEQPPTDLSSITIHLSYIPVPNALSEDEVPSEDEAPSEDDVNAISEIAARQHAGKEAKTLVEGDELAAKEAIREPRGPAAEKAALEKAAEVKKAAADKIATDKANEELAERLAAIPVLTTAQPLPPEGLTPVAHKDKPEPAPNIADTGATTRMKAFLEAAAKQRLERARVVAEEECARVAAEKAKSDKATPEAIASELTDRLSALQHTIQEPSQTQADPALAQGVFVQLPVYEQGAVSVQLLPSAQPQAVGNGPLSPAKSSW
jgi:hypothetical protein